VQADREKHAAKELAEQKAHEENARTLPVEESTPPDPLPGGGTPAKPSMLELAWLFAFIGLTSFGGGISAYIRRLVVTQKRWLTDEEFLPGLGLVQLLPGANVAGLAVYIGNHLKGPLGSAVALFCLFVPLRNHLRAGLPLLPRRTHRRCRRDTWRASPRPPAA